MKLSHFITLLVVIAVAWASLFITVLHQSRQTEQLLKNDHQLLSQDTTILNAQKKTEADLEMKIADLQSHVDCLFNLATQPSGSHISDASSCTIAPAANSPAPANTPAPQSTSTPATQPSNSEQSNNTNSSKPKNKPLVCKLTLGAFGC